MLELGSIYVGDSMPQPIRLLSSPCWMMSTLAVQHIFNSLTVQTWLIGRDENHALFSAGDVSSIDIATSSLT